MTEERRSIPLVEYGSTVETLSQRDVRELLAIGGGAIELAPTSEPSRYRLKAGSKVGAIATSRLDVLIRPKIPIENVFLLLEPARVPIDLRSEVIGFGQYEELTPAFAAFFARMLEHTLIRGMRRDYVVMEESLVAVRGRLQMERQMRSPVLTPAHCRFDEHSIDTPHNRVLKAAANRLVRLPGIGVQNRNTLRHLLMWFGEVGDHPPAPRAVLRRGFTRLDAYYEPAVRLACMILDGASLDHGLGDVTANTFLIDMNRAFEAFLEVRLAASLRGTLTVRGQVATHLDADRQVRMRPDLLFLRNETAAYVGDAKYKVTSDITGVDSDLYQLLAYTTALGLSEGVLIYAQSDEAVTPAAVQVSKAGKRLQIRRIDLRGNPATIRRAVEELASWIASRVATGANT